MTKYTVRPEDITPIGYQGAAQHTYTPACDGFHEPGQCPYPQTTAGCRPPSGGYYQDLDTGEIFEEYPS